MTTTNYKVGTHQIIGNPKADWSHVSAYVADLHRQSLIQEKDILSDEDEDADLEFRNRLLAAGGVDELSEEDRILVATLADGIDLDELPGGANYNVSQVSETNPLGLPGDLWALVTDAEEGAQVVMLMQPDNVGGLNIMAPHGRGWEPLYDLGLIEDYDIVGVMPDAVELYHNYDRDNNLGVISSYPLSPQGPYPTMAQLQVPMSTEIMDPREEDDEFWENSKEDFNADRPVMASVVLQRTEDVESAISAAMDNPDLRWYVERRVAALGLEVDLPWLSE